MVEKEFEDEDGALKYAIHAQRDRRNLTEAALLVCIEVLDKRLDRGGDRRSAGEKSKAPNGVIEKSAQSTAKILGVSTRKVERHASIRMTVDIYGHLIPSNDGALVNRLDTQPSATYPQPTKMEKA